MCSYTGFWIYGMRLIQSWAKKWSVGFEKFMPGPARSTFQPISVHHIDGKNIYQTYSIV